MGTADLPGSGYVQLGRCIDDKHTLQGVISYRHYSGDLALFESISALPIVTTGAQLRY